MAVLLSVRIVHFCDDFDRSTGSGGFPTAEAPSAARMWAVGKPPFLRLRLPRWEISGLAKCRADNSSSKPYLALADDFRS